MNLSSNDAVASQATLTPDLTASSGKITLDTSHTQQHPPSSVRPKELIDRTLDFLATASNETLVGVFVLLAFVTYIILGRVGLVLIGIGLGVILHASWEGSTQAGSSGESQMPKKRRELALEVTSRLLDWPERATFAQVASQDDSAIVAAPEDLSIADLEYTAFQPATGAALRSLTDAVVRDYVKYWYEPILPSESAFPGSCRRTLTYFITTVSSHLARKRTEDTFLQFLTNSSSIIIVFLNELAAAFAAADPRSTEAKKIVEQYLENSPDSSLANVLSEEQQRKKLNMIADDILSNFLDPQAYSCSPVRDFLREIFAGVVLESTVKSLSRPEFINDWIIYLLRDGESEIMHAIDAGVEGARNQSAHSSKVSEDSKNALLESTNIEAASRVAGLPPSNQDKATEQATLEAKRLSAMIASQDIQGTIPGLPADGIQPQERVISTERTNGSLERLSTDTQDSAAAQENLASPHASLGAQATPSAPFSAREDATAPPVTLHGARVLVDDDAARSEKGLIKSRPTWDYLLQIEPASSRATGWMVFRKYSDFQSLHEMLATVSRLNRIQTFSDLFPTLPQWKGKTRPALAQDLERYLQEAMKHEPLAETERMRRFVEKEGGSGEGSSTKQGFSFPSQSAFENMGKDLLGALTNAPKGMAGGGRTVFDGVTGVFGGVAGHNRKPSNTSDRQFQPRKNPLNTGQDTPASSGSANALPRDTSSPVGFKMSDWSGSPRPSEEQDSPAPVSSPTSTSVGLGISKEGGPKFPAISDTGSSVNVAASEQDACALDSPPAPSGNRNSLGSTSHMEELETKQDTEAALPSPQNETEPSDDSGIVPQGTRRQRAPITADETQIAVELIFAVINELYTLSSAWNIRRTLLNAAKTYILRPGSPTLETIRGLLQESMIENHTSDEALGEYLKKLRENALPTETELKAWPAAPSEQEKAHLRDTARRLFVQRGIPQALTSVMGAAASREALEKIFDSLQVETVARGFVFSVMLQGLRVLTL
ncbi:uncharacterized protein N7482_010235 [Penicillium canariense]|uniref:PXA domain-containing protein n=1 Tax=Penicillium canariense TaxID=189055 RepID=A0A9W9LE50_9EURO|nr:uncharacterized protein N7482_010235 [Penicillium canariense]KAJ5150983.1 hypothetical protein N7482_010235 [Penicillium canariense]